MPNAQETDEKSAAVMSNISAAINGRGVSFDWSREESLQRCYSLHDDGRGNLTEQTLFDTVSRFGHTERLGQELEKMIRNGNFFFYKKGEPEPFSLGLSDETSSGISVYPSGSSYQIPEPEPLGFLKNLMNRWFGMFEEEAEFCRNQKAAYDDFRNSQQKYQEYHDRKPKNGRGGVDYIANAQRIAQQKENLRSADIDAVRELDRSTEYLSAEYDEMKRIPEGDRTEQQKQFLEAAGILGRPLRAPLSREEKLGLRFSTDPQRLVNKELVGRALRGCGFGKDSFVETLGDDSMLTEALPLEGEATPGDAKKLAEALKKLDEATRLRNEAGSSDSSAESFEKEQQIRRTLSRPVVDYLTDLCRTNIETMNRKLKTAGIEETTEFYTDAIPLAAQTVGTHIQLKAEVTQRIARQLGYCLPKDSPERVDLLAVRLRGKALSSFGSGLISPNQGKMVPSLQMKQKIEEINTAGMPDAYEDVFRGDDPTLKTMYEKSREELKNILPQTPYHRLQIESDVLTGEKAQRLAADIVVDVMNKNLFPGVNPRQVAEDLAGRKDFQDMVGAEPGKIAAMAKSGDLLKKTAALFSEEAEQKKSAVVSKSKVRAAEGPEIVG